MKLRNTRRRFIKNTFVAGTMSSLAMQVARPVLANSMQNDIPKAIFLYVPDGVYCPKDQFGNTDDSQGQWHPTGTPENFGSNGLQVVQDPTLNTMTQTFSGIKEHITFLQGLDMNGGAGSHQGGAQKVLTGNGKNSLDVVLGQQENIGGQTPVRSMNLGAMANFQAGTTDHVHYLNGVSIKPEDDPVAAFNRIYGFGGGSGGYDSRRDIITLVHQELAALMNNDLGYDERLKLDTHVDALNDLQKKMDGVSDVGDAGGICDPNSFNQNHHDFSSPDGQYPLNIHKEENFENIANLQVDLITRMLSCDMTRVASLQMSHTTSNYKGHHGISHNFSSTWVNSLNFFYGFVNKLVTQLKNTPDGSSNLLDNTLIYVNTCLSDGKLHDHRDMPFMLIGGHNHGVQGNRKIRYPLGVDGKGVDHTKLLVSIANYMGHDINSFGTNGVSGALEGIIT